MPTTITRTASLKVEQLTARIGAVVHGLRLSGELDGPTVAALREALHRHKVLFFRGQYDLTDPEQEAFAGLFGETQCHPLVKPPEGTKAVFELDSANGLRVNGWHTDLTYQERISYASVLRAIELPTVGGDTLWANTAAAYQTLPEPLRALVDRAWARHSTDEAGMPEKVDGVYARNPGIGMEAVHPVVHRVPETGEPAILMGFFFRQILGMSYMDSLRVYEMVQAHVTRPENVVRWRWAPGDVAMWFNHATQHYAVADYSERRIMHRVSIDGEKPLPAQA
ncbi:MAG TPA: TauD/TfdA family dioxygenase [Novosphingobium sp.]